MTWRESVVEALENLGGSGKLSDIYQEVRRLRRSRQETLPTSTDAVIRKELEYNSSDSSNWKGEADLFFSVNGIGNGHWGLVSLKAGSPKAIDLDQPEDDEASRSETTVLRIIRDTEMTRGIKSLYDQTCQICSSTIELPNGNRYSEAHHIIPLGKPHNGPDKAGNIIVVCPTHHAMLDSLLSMAQQRI